MAPTEPAIEASLADSDLPDAEALVREAGWNQVAADWNIFRTLGTVYAARTRGRVVATAATLPYGEFAWVSMVLVATEFRRAGLGTRLLNRCIEDLRGKGLVPALDATPAGRPLYRGLGFQETWGLQRCERRGVPPPPADTRTPANVVVRLMTEADWPALCAYDAAAFGADRSPLLKRMRGRLPPAELIATRGDAVVGILFGREGRTASQLGPLVAEADDIALALLARALPAFAGPIYIDLADSKTKVFDWLKAGGFTVQRPYTRMLLGRERGYDDPLRTFAVVGPEFG